MYRLTAVSIALVIATGTASPASSDGALAIGLPGNVARGGIAFGLSWGLADEASAVERAMKECREFRDAPASTLALCKLIRTFKDQCVAAAIDPKPGTPGYGWALAPSTAQAGSEALDFCKRTAGKGRERFCQVTTVRCDGTAK